MKLPSGVLMKNCMPLTVVDFKKSLSKMMEKKFSGYVKVSVEEGNGIEEGTLLLRNGRISAASYEYLAQNALIHSQKALEHIFNASLSQNGVLDVAKLSEAELDLGEAANKAALMHGIGKASLSRFSASAFNPKLYEKTFGAFKKTESKEAMFKRLGIDKLSK